MRIARTLILLAFMAAFATAHAEVGKIHKFRVYFTDKKESPFVKSKPEQFLSQKAIARRKKWHIKVDWYDLPVTPKYVSAVAATGAKVLCTSKWNNTVLVSDTDAAVADKIARLPFVKAVTNVYYGPASVSDSVPERYKVFRGEVGRSSNYYGDAWDQINGIGGVRMHESGFLGQGMTIAIIDGGFLNADTIPLLDNVRILGTHNFVRPQRSVFAEGDHGTCVLSCMGANKPFQIVGTAPGASFWLLVSEDGYSETPSEEDTWAAAIEFADSVGADVVNSSLGYNTFDDASQNVRYTELDGKTHLVSRSASLAASRGLLVCNSAGNAGDEAWKLIGIPADADNILTVGAMDRTDRNADFSSIGNTTDGRVKPDVMAMGVADAVVRGNGRLGRASGTSFSSPVTAGMVACLMQALPSLKPVEIIRLLHSSSTRYNHPDNIFGYGIPDYYEAYRKGNGK